MATIYHFMRGAEALRVVQHHRVALGPLESLALPLCDGLSADAEERVRGWLPGLVDCEEVSDPFLPGTYEGW